MTTLMVT